MSCDIVYDITHDTATCRLCGYDFTTGHVDRFKHTGLESICPNNDEQKNALWIARDKAESNAEAMKMQAESVAKALRAEALATVEAEYIAGVTTEVSIYTDDVPINTDPLTTP